MGIRDRPIAPASPWQNGFAERLIGSIRRECLDHVIILGEAHLRRILKSYARYYLTLATIMGRARTCPWIRTRPYRVLLRGQGVFFAAQSSADCITNMSGFDLRQAQRDFAAWLGLVPKQMSTGDRTILGRTSRMRCT